MPEFRIVCKMEIQRSITADNWFTSLELLKKCIGFIYSIFGQAGVSMHTKSWGTIGKWNKVNGKKKHFLYILSQNFNEDI